MKSVPTSGAKSITHHCARSGVDNLVHGWTTACPPINPGRILRLHGYSDRQKVRPAIIKAADLIADEARGLVAAQGCWRRVSVTSSSGGNLQFADGVRLECPAFDRLLQGVEEVIAFVLTLGAGFDRAVGDLIERFEPLEALFMETAGRLAIEKITRVMANDVGMLLKGEGLTLGTRLGPGYTYRVSAAPGGPRVIWPLEQQEDLFRLFRDTPLPVELRHSAVMVPKMSRSGLIAVHSSPNS